MSLRDPRSASIVSESDAKLGVANLGPIDIGGTVKFWVTKRLFDIVMALVLLPVVALGGFLLLIANPFLNPGPLFFVQTRIGRRGLPFRMIKFRTMRISPADSPGKFASSETSRITPFASRLRKIRYDELPQVWNVLLGEMSFVGPRPEQLPFVRQFEIAIPNYCARHNVRPGITGLAQITNGYADCEETTRQKLVKDLEYIERAGWILEIWIVLKTVQVVLTGFGAI